MTGYHPYPKTRVAAVQAGSVFREAPVWFDTEATLQKAVDFITEAGKNGARLVVFPEAFLPCYPHFALDLTDRPTFNAMWAKYLACSIEVPGPETDALCEAAKRSNTYVVMGINERDKEFLGRMYNSILYISPQGTIMGTHRKICTTIHERFFHTAGDGGENLKTVYKTEIGTIGGSICGEHAQILQVYNWIIQGMQIHCSLWPGETGLETAVDIQSRALCYTSHSYGVVSAGYIPDKDFPKIFYKNCRFNIPGGFRGGSGIVNPAGEYVAGPVYDEETIVYGDIDLENNFRTRVGVNLTGIYDRRDLYNLNVRQDSYQAVTPMERKPDVSAEEIISNLEKKIVNLEQKISRLQNTLQEEEK